jgi:UDP-glucose 4-epimerase
MRVLITGGAGFIGSYLLERLVSQDVEVTILDNLSSGSKKNVNKSLNKGDTHFMHGDCAQTSDVEGALRDVDTVFHLSANPEVRLERNDPETCFQQNIYPFKKKPAPTPVAILGIRSDSTPRYSARVRRTVSQQL